MPGGSGAPVAGPDRLLTLAFSGVDANGRMVQIPAFLLVNHEGVVIAPLSEATGQQILDMLTKMNDKLAQISGVLP